MKYAKPILLSIPVGLLLDVLIPDHVMNVVFVVTMSLLLFGILLVAFGTVTKNRWGINLGTVNCPTCGSPMPKVRATGIVEAGPLGWRQLQEVRLRNG